MIEIAPGIRILHLEDAAADTELVESALRRVQQACTLLRVDDEQSFVRALEDFNPDVVLSDHAVAHFSAAEALRVVQLRRPTVPFLLVAGALEQNAAACLLSGAVDFVPKADLSRLPTAIAAALSARAPLRKLTDRQRQIFQLLAAGGSTREIARRLKLSVKTVETHRAEIMRRLGIRGLAALVRYAMRVGLIRPEP